MNRPMHAGEAAVRTPEQRFRHHLQANAGVYLPGADPAACKVRLLERQARRTSRLYRFELKAAGQRQVVLVKACRDGAGFSDKAASDADFSARDWTQVPGVASESGREYAAMAAIHAHFSELGDPRFHAVRVFEFLPADVAWTMDVVERPSLRTVMLRSLSPLARRSTAELEPAFRNAGAWLRAYHAIPAVEGAVLARASRAELMQRIEQITSFLAEHLRERSLFEALSDTLAATAAEKLGEVLPLGLSHGDYAPRNVLVGPEHQITALDTRAWWVTCIYYDIGYFLTHMKHNLLQVATRGSAFSRASLRRWEEAFLSGYFGDGAVPIEAVRLHEIVATLDRWSSVVARTRAAPGVRSSVRALAAAFASRYFRSAM